ncbi:MAG: DUF4386 domain-containing protein [Bacteroidetes bacterium]|nr:DUF4386 domain-containing protein [Fibrella sp.]
MQTTLDVSTQAVIYDRPPVKRWLIGLIMAEIICVVAPVGILSAYFRFPEILREPASVMLPLFTANESVIVPAYYVFMVSGLLFLPLSCAFSAALKPGSSSALRRALIGTGVAAAIFQAIGFSRWVFIVPFLAEQYGRQPTQRPTIALLYETLNRYAGMTIGEHLGFLAMGCWTILLALLLLRRSVVKRWFAALGLPIGAGLLVSTGEHFGGSAAELYGTINFLANTCWSVWLLGIGVGVLFYRPVYQSVEQSETTRTILFD